MKITRACKADCRAIAELAMMAGEGIPAYFWQQSLKQNEDLFDVGARNAASETENFSYRNTWLSFVDGEVAGMLLAYRLPDADQSDNPEDYPKFIQPLIELENRVPGSFYINMLATYPAFRGQGIGAALMAEAEQQATMVGCNKITVQVFDENTGAVKLYKRLGYSRIDEREVIPHSCLRYRGKVLLLEKLA